MLKSTILAPVRDYEFGYRVFDQDEVRKVRWGMGIKKYQTIEQRTREKNKVFVVSGITP
jgi:hypothetical protein